ncbi:MAG: Trm112 family protein [Actinomycetota bacterium]
MPAGASAINQQLLEILACPKDQGGLIYFADEDALYNPRLQMRYEVRQGIPVMLIDEAVTVTQVEHERLMSKAKQENLKPNF